MNLAIDIGNSATKIGLFNKDQLQMSLDNFDTGTIITFIEKNNIDRVIISSVGKDRKDMINSINKKCDVMVLDQSTKLPVNIKYTTPETLGTDRLAAVTGANFLHPGQNCLVLDAGTCITFDLIDEEANYLGGSISPGIDLKYKALHNFTAQLPLIEFKKMTALTGNSTENAIQSGVVNGTIAEINGLINQYLEKYDGLKIIFCGGAAKFFESRIKAHIFVVSELVLIGLNRILNYNED